MDPPRLVLESGELVSLQFAEGSKLAHIERAFPDHLVVDLATSEVPSVLRPGKKYLLVPPVRLQELSGDWTPFLERCRAAAGVVLPQAASARQSQKKARSSLIGNAEEEEEAALHSPDTFGTQRKLSTAVLQNLGIVVRPVVPEQNDRVWSIALHDAELEWVLLVFRHRRFRLPAYLETLVGERNRFPELRFLDGEYTLSSLGGALSFDTTNHDFDLCARVLAELLHSETPQRLGAAHGEGTKEMDLYAWLYICLTAGCANTIERAWRGTVRDMNYLGKNKVKVWRPDGIIGFTKAALPGVNISPLAELVYLGLIAIEHKKDEHDLSDINVVLYEMRMMCMQQVDLGWEHPFAFGIYWAGTRFLLYGMEVHHTNCGNQFHPHLLLQYSSSEPMELVLIFRALWYLRLHAIQTAELAQRQPADLQRRANVYAAEARSKGDDGNGDDDENDGEGEGNDKHNSESEDDSGSGRDSASDGDKGDEDASSDGRSEGKDESDGDSSKGKDDEAKDGGIEEYSNQGTRAMNQTKASITTLVKASNGHQLYELLSCISKGNAAEVYLARNVANGQLAAVKRRLTDNWIHYQEVHALRILEGVPGVVRLIDEGRAIPGRGDTSWANRELVLILEYIDGAPAHLEDMPTLASVRLFFYQLTRTLLKCHKRGILHYDIKPDNVLLTNDMRAVVIDFDHSVDVARCDKEILTAGTPGYTCPELSGISLELPTTAADTWSLGVMLLQSLMWIYPRSDGAALRLVQQLHAAPRGQACSFIQSWAHNAPADKLKKLLFNRAANQAWTPAPWCTEEGLDLARRLLKLNPKKRLALVDALAHPFLSACSARA